MFSLKKDCVIIAAGGTGGHICPALSVVEQLLDDNYSVIFITDKRFNKYVNKATLFTGNNHFKLVELRTINYNGFWGKLKQSVLMFLDTLSCINIIIRYKVKVVIGFGSYISLISAIASVLTRTALLIHEQNATLGRANKISIIFAKYCMTTFPNTGNISNRLNYKTINTGIPIRKEIKMLSYSNDHAMIDYSVFFKIYSTLNIAVLGGSQGASIFSKIMPDTLKMLDNEILKKINIVHQAPLKDVEMLMRQYNHIPVKAVVKHFFSDIWNTLSTTHILISRSGSSTIAEIATLGVPSILIPLKSADNHQYLNAKHMRDIGGAIILEEKDLTPQKLLSLLQKLINKDNALYELSINAKTFSQITANLKVKTIIDYVIGRNINHHNITTTSNHYKFVKNNIGIG